MAEFAKFVFPLASLKFINVIKPDTFFDEENPKYQVTLVYGAAEGQKVLDAMAETFPACRGKVPVKKTEDGNYEFKVAQKRFISWEKQGEKRTMEMKPKIILADNTAYDGTDPWSGSTGEVAAEIATTNAKRGAAIALRLRGVRFHDIKTGDSQDGEDDALFGSQPKVMKPEEDAILEAAFDDSVNF